MKRLLVTLLSLVYFVASSGILLRHHYCMGDLIETQIDFGLLVAANACGDCGMEESENTCCESKITILKKVEDQKATDFQILQLTDFSADIIPIFFQFGLVNTAFQELLPVLALQKPPPKSLPVFLQNRNLRI